MVPVYFTEKCDIALYNSSSLHLRKLYIFFILLVLNERILQQNVNFWLIFWIQNFRFIFALDLKVRKGKILVRAKTDSTKLTNHLLYRLEIFTGLMYFKHLKYCNNFSVSLLFPETCCVTNLPCKHNKINKIISIVPIILSSILEPQSLNLNHLSFQ